MTMRERMARAMFEHDCKELALQGNYSPLGPWDKMDVSEHQCLMKRADVALDLLTARPTERMISAGLQECTHAAFAMDADDVQRIYETMTAAMIKEGVPNA